jgi:DNA-binding NarL/FixJ family response regulator
MSARPIDPTPFGHSTVMIEPLILIQGGGRSALPGQPANLRVRALGMGENVVLVSFSLGRLMALTRAELEVARWAHMGHSNIVIARERRTAIHTVAGQMVAAMRKLGIGARLWLATVPELGAWAPQGLGLEAACDAPLESLLSRTHGELAPQDMARVWREVAAGQWSTLTGIDADGLRHAVMSRGSETPVDWQVLRPMHRLVLAHLADGCPQKVIAMKLGMPPSTVSATLDGARRRLGFGALHQLVRAYSAARDVVVQGRQKEMAATPMPPPRIGATRSETGGSTRGAAIS